MTRRASPFQMLAVTFTNKAAREMRDRVGALIGAATEGWWMGTFHALAARILRRHAELVGLKSNFTILDSDDQIRLIKQLLKAESIDDKKWPARAVLSVIERWKDRALTPDKLKPEDGGDMAAGRWSSSADAYQERLISLNACDFGDLLLHNITLFQTNPDVLAEYQQRFRYLLVDEYQDTNVAQYLWLRLLAGLRISAVSATTINRFMDGAAPKSATYCVSRTIFPALRSFDLPRQNYPSTDRLTRCGGWAYLQ